MPIDASIYGQIQQPQSPLDQYGKALNLRALMDESKLRQLQTGKLESDIGKENAVDQLFANAPSGATLESLLPDVYRLGGAKHGVDLQGKLLTQQKTKADLAHTTAQTGDIMAGHISGAMAALAKGDGSDESVRQAHDIMVSAGVPEAQASEATQRVLAVPQPLRLAYVTAQAGQNKVGQAALKLFFPQAHMQDTGGQVTPVSTSTMPGGLAPGTPIPDAAPIPKTVSPDTTAHIAATERGQNMVDARTRELNGILEGSTNTPSPALVKGIASGEIPLTPPPTNARNPIMLQRYGNLLEAVKAENPNWSAEMHPTIKKTVAAFADGKEGQTVKALNTATDHVETLRELVAAVKNGNIQTFNRIANQWASATGNPAPANLSVAAQVIGGEIVKGIVGAGGGTGERERAENAFAAVKSPADAEGAINTVTKLMGGQFKGMRQQYEAGTYGRKDFAEKYLTPAARKALESATATKPAEPKPSGKAEAGWKIEEVRQ